MKQALFLVLICLYACAVPPSAPAPTLPLDIDISKLTSSYLSLKSYQGDTVIIGGSYTGDRIVLKDASRTYIIFQGCTIESTHAEDALVFGEAVRDMVVDGSSLKIIGGGITFWDSAHNVQLYGGEIEDTHTGIRATKDIASSRLVISGWKISKASHEGIYIGPSKSTDKKLIGIVIARNIIKETGWDGLQVGNCRSCILHGNEISDAGRAEEYGQDYGVTINPGSLVYYYGNQVQTPKPIQVLDSRAFFHAP